jgi:hypothetical protein
VSVARYHGSCLCGGCTYEGHIFCADQGDYYTIPDEGYRLPQWK